MKRFIVYAASISPVGTMGGNSKIAIEIVRNLAKDGWKVVVIVPSAKKATFTINLPPSLSVEYVEMADFIGNDMYDVVASWKHYSKEITSAFARLNVGPEDVVYATCNFHFDILPLIREKRKRHFTYIATHYLFTPFIFENLIRHYRFPAIKYLLVWFYERSLFVVNRMIADAFVITNDDDVRQFSKRWKDRLFAFYGGVNIEQIPEGDARKTRDVVFCSRLHPQKGIEGLLEIWAIVHAKLSKAKLSVIGNGDAGYEAKLRNKCEALGLGEVVEWLGYVNNEAKYEIYKSAKVLAHSTIFDNNGMVAAEALCAGLPVVMYDLSALRHVYRSGCIKIPYGDQAAYAEALVNVLEGKTSPAPTAAEVEELRCRWDWKNRVAAFEKWMEGWLS